MFRGTILICTLLLLLAPTWTQSVRLSDGNYEGTYNRERGGNDCPRKIRFDVDGTRVNADRVRVNDDQCSGPQFTFERNRVTDSDRLTGFLNRLDDRFGAAWVTGALSGNVTCGEGSGAVTLPEGTRLTFFSLDDEDESWQWSDVYGDNAEIADNNRFTADDDVVYLVQGNGDCLYEREGALGEVLDDAEEAVEDAADDVEDNVCFSASTTVLLESGRSMRMDQLSVGDRVLVRPGMYSDVFMFSHADAAYSSSNYVRLRAHDRSTITMTQSHYIYVNDGLLPAKEVKVGDVLTKGDGSKVKVTRVDHNVREQGLYNPHTLHGDIVVDGILCSTYTTSVEPKIAHWLLSPLRNVYRFLSVNPSGPTTEL